MNIQKLYTYSDNCRTVLRATLAQYPELFDKRFSTVSPNASIRGLCIHSTFAEEYCVQHRIQGKEIDRSGMKMPETVGEVFDNWDRVRAETWNYIKGADDQELQHEITVELDDIEENLTGRMTAEEILFQVISHEIHHRGQISMALQQMGITPPDFDYLFLHSEISAALLPR